MSAWVVARAHIDVLVLAGVQFGVPYDPACRQPVGPAVLAAAGAELWGENVRSVNHRYGEDDQAEEYPAPAAEVVLDAVAVVKAVDCYVYQSCEHPDWAATRAANYCARLRDAAMTGLPLAAPQPGERRRYPVGYDAAPWGIDDLAQAAAGRVGTRGGR